MEKKEDLLKIRILYTDHYFQHTYYCMLAWMSIRNELLEEKVISKSEYEKINHLIAWHDNSKISDEEFMPYAMKFYSKQRDEEKIKSQFKEAVKHHKDCNLHHFEALRSYNGNDWKCYIIELICDYIAMGWEFKNYLFEYYQSTKDKINLPSEYREYLERVMDIIREKCYESVESPMDLKREMIILNKE